MDLSGSLQKGNVEFDNQEEYLSNLIFVQAQNVVQTGFLIPVFIPVVSTTVVSIHTQLPLDDLLRHTAGLVILVVFCIHSCTDTLFNCLNYSHEFKTDGRPSTGNVGKMIGSVYGTSLHR